MIGKRGSASRTRRVHFLIMGCLFGVVECASLVSGGALLAAIIGGLCLAALSVLAVPLWLGRVLERRQDARRIKAGRDVQGRLYGTASTTVIPAITSHAPGGAGRSSSPCGPHPAGLHSTTGRHRLQAAS